MSPTLAAAMCLAGKHEGLNATIDATLNGSALFTRIGMSHLPTWAQTTATERCVGRTMS